MPIRYAIHKGATLIEILISLIVISIGMIGVAALQVSQLYQVAEANIEYIVTQQVNDIADRIRANPIGTAAGYYDSISLSIPTGERKNCSKDCTPEQLANVDAKQWNENNASLLPNGSGTVSSSDQETFTITITWSNKENATLPTSGSGTNDDFTIIITDKGLNSYTAEMLL